MGLAALLGAGIIALAIAMVMLWGAFEALVRVIRFLWRLLVVPGGTGEEGQS